MAERRVESPDGREWELRVVRLVMPAWRPAEFDLWEDATSTGGFVLFVLSLPIALALWILWPLFQLFVTLPLALVRALVSKTRWIEADSRLPSQMLIRWKTSLDRADAVAAEIAGRLGRGEDIRVDGATLVAVTPPLALRDFGA